MTEKTICEKLHRRFHDATYKLNNVFVFKHDWESDFFMQNRNGYCYEIEVKISRADFFNDKKKVAKHQILSSGSYKRTGTLSTYNRELRLWEDEDKETEHTHDMRPNKFFYVVPEGLITADEVPAYAGLMYCYEDEMRGIVTIKEAPFIHKEKLSIETKLCRKFYYYWMEERGKRLVAEHEKELLEQRYQNLLNQQTA